MKPSNITYEEAAPFQSEHVQPCFSLEKLTFRTVKTFLFTELLEASEVMQCKLSKYFGATVTGVCSSSNLEWVKSLGADKAIDYTASDFSTIDGAYDVIFEAVNKSAFSDCMKLLKADGTYINIVEPLPSAQMLWTKLTSRKKLILSQNAPETSEALNFLKELVENGKIKVVIDRQYNFAEIIEAHIYVEKGIKGKCRHKCKA